MLRAVIGFLAVSLLVTLLNAPAVSVEPRGSNQKIAAALDFRPVVDVEESVINALEKLRSFSFSDFEDPRYYNIRWLKLLEEAERVLDAKGSLFGVPGQSGRAAASVRPLRGMA